MSAAKPLKRKKKPKPALLVIELLVLLAAIAAITFALHGTYTKYYTAAYPDGYGDEVRKYAEMYELSPSLVYGIIRVESNFDPAARSHADAVGLMQVTPTTLEWIQMRSDFADGLTIDALVEPDMNIHCGSYALSLLYELFDCEDTVIAAYNAGLGNVQDWLEDPRYSDDGVTLKAIPFEETTNYVKRVRAAQESYQELYHIP